MKPAPEPEESTVLDTERARTRDQESHFELVIRVRHDEMARWTQERMATFFEAVSVLMAAKSQAAIEPRRMAAPAGGAAVHQTDETSDDVQQRIKRIEQSVDSVRRHVATLHESIAEDFKAFEETLASQGNVIQSTRSAMSQTDDLVERVVEALEVLQTSGIQRTEECAAAAVN